MFEMEPGELPDEGRPREVVEREVYESLGGPVYGAVENARLMLRGPFLSGMDSVTVGYQLRGGPAHRTDVEVTTEVAEDFGPDERGVPSHVGVRLDAFGSNYAQGREVAVEPVSVRSGEVRVDGAARDGVYVTLGEFWAVGVLIDGRHLIAVGHVSAPVREFVTVFPLPAGDGGGSRRRGG